MYSNPFALQMLTLNIRRTKYSVLRRVRGIAETSSAVLVIRVQSHWCYNRSTQPFHPLGGSTLQ